MNNQTRHLTTATTLSKMTPVGFEPTQLALVELESTPLDHSGKVSLSICEGDSASRERLLSIGPGGTKPPKTNGCERQGREFEPSWVRFVD